MRQFLVDDDNIFQAGVGGGVLLNRYALPADSEYLLSVVNNLNNFMQANCNIPNLHMNNDICKESAESECVGYLEFMGRMNKKYDYFSGLVDAAMKRVTNERCDLYLSMGKSASLKNPVENHYADGGCLASYGSKTNGTDYFSFNQPAFNPPTFVKQKMRVCYNLPHLVAVEYLRHIDVTLFMARSVHQNHRKTTNIINSHQKFADIYVADSKGLLQQFYYNYNYYNAGPIVNKPSTYLSDLLRSLYVEGNVYNADKLRLMPAKYDSMLPQAVDLDRCANTRFFGESAVSFIYRQGSIMRATLYGIADMESYHMQHHRVLMWLSAHRHNLKVYQSMLDQNYCYRISENTVGSDPSYGDNRHSDCVKTLLEEASNSKLVISRANELLFFQQLLAFLLPTFVFMLFATIVRVGVDRWSCWGMEHTGDCARSDAISASEGDRSADAHGIDGGCCMEFNKKVVFENVDNKGTDIVSDSRCFVVSDGAGKMGYEGCNRIEEIDNGARAEKDTHDKSGGASNDEFDVTFARHLSTPNDNNSLVVTTDSVCRILGGGSQPSCQITYCRAVSNKNNPEDSVGNNI